MLNADIKPKFLKNATVTIDKEKQKDVDKNGERDRERERERESDLGVIRIHDRKEKSMSRR